jgi:hypothetical protein
MGIRTRRGDQVQMMSQCFGSFRLRAEFIPEHGERPSYKIIVFNRDLGIKKGTHKKQAKMKNRIVYPPVWGENNAVDGFKNIGQTT